MTSADLVTAFYRIGQVGVGGYVFDPAAPDTRFVIEIRLDGEHVGLVLADAFSAELRTHQGGDGCHGFTLVLPHGVSKSRRLCEAVIANTGTVIGSFVWGDEDGADDASSGSILGEVTWQGGLRVAGYACDLARLGRPVELELVVEGATLLRFRPDRWLEASAGGTRPRGRFAFDVPLPLSMADGRRRSGRILAGGIDLEGSPFDFVVHDGGYEGIARSIDPQDASHLLERARLLDRLAPSAVPLASAAAWLDRFPAQDPGPVLSRLGVLIVGGSSEAIEGTLASLEQQSHPMDVAVAVPETDAPTAQLLDATDDRAFADASTSMADRLLEAVHQLVEADVDGVIVVSGGTTLHRHGLKHFAAALEAPSAPGLVFCDVVHRIDDRLVPVAFPVLDRIRLWAQGYGADAFAVPTTILEAAIEQGADGEAAVGEAEVAEGASSAFDVMFSSLRQCDRGGDVIGHLPEFLASLDILDLEERGRGLASAVQRDLDARGVAETARLVRHGRHFPVVERVPISARRLPPVSIIVQAREGLDRLQACIDGIRSNTTGVEYEIVVVDRALKPDTARGPHEDGTTQDMVWGEGVRFVRPYRPCNNAGLKNLGAMEARHPVLCFLDADVEAIEPGWLLAMLEILAGPAGGGDGRDSDEPGVGIDVGIVGATLISRDYLVQEAGLVLSMRNGAASPFVACADGDEGYGDMLLVPRLHAAVSSACMLVGKDVFQAVGSFDAVAFPSAFHDVDFCLRIGAQGKAVVVSPAARLVWMGGLIGGRDARNPETIAVRRELASLRERWGDLLDDDPFYNPNLGLDPFAFAGLAVPPRMRRLRTS